MFASLTGLLPLISVASLLIVSANTIGYFSRIGPHFLGLMDLTNFVYPVGLAFLGLTIAIQVIGLAHFLVTRLRINLTTIAAFAGVIFFGAWGIAGWLVHKSEIRDAFHVALAAAAISMGFAVVFGTFAFVRFDLSRRKVDSRMTNMTVAFFVGILVVSYFVGGAQAEYQAFRTQTLYKITDKHGFDTVVRIIRASSSGLLVASSDRRIIFVPKEEYRQVEREKPISLFSE